jgi:hypothetical protein
MKTPTLDTVLTTMTTTVTMDPASAAALLSHLKMMVVVTNGHP